MISPYQQQLRDRFLACPETPPPAPWRLVHSRTVSIGGLQSIGFAQAPGSGHDLVLVASSSGLGVFDCVTGQKLARDSEADESPMGAELSCEGIGPLAGVRVPMAGLYGGGLHTSAVGWTVNVVYPEWPHERILLSTDSMAPYRQPHGDGWWCVFDSNYSELRAAGFSPSGQTLAVATSSDLTLWAR
ncbi:hypothetical protein ACFCV3_22765 [Kribbella sp. NPDC056345]|uniref:hypothetical protein n=1 Tax=Kribbella sp. NPDC056345 TaxID=3345789 RepID=UPI0035D966EE